MKRMIIVCLVILVVPLLLSGCGPCPAKPAPAPVAAPQAKPAMVVAPCNVAGQTKATGQYPGAGEVKLEKIVPEFVYLNNEFTYRIEATNVGTAALQNVVVTDTIAPNVKVISTDPQAKIADNTAKWAIGSLNAGEKKVMTVKGVATGPATISGCAAVTYDKSLCAEIKVLEPKVVAVVAAPKEVLLCDDIPVEYTVTNSGNAEICAATLAAVVPAGIKPADSAQKTSFEMPRILPGKSQKVTMVAKAMKPGQYTFGGNLEADGGIKAQANTVTVNVVNCDLKVETSAPDMRYIGRSAKIDVKVTNAGTGVARDTAVVTTAKGGVLGGASDGGVVAGDKVTWKVGALKPGESRSMSVNLSSAAVSEASIASAASAYCCPAVTATAQTKFAGISAILLEVIDVSDPIEIGAEETYVITVTNQGSAADKNIKVICKLDGNMQYVSSSGPTAGSAREGAVEFAPLASLAAGQKATWKVVVKATAAADARFYTQLNSDMLTSIVSETESTHFYK
jgi:uncharacterized repeat protein (TIGR01451 family)